MGHNRRENEQRINAFVERYASAREVDAELLNEQGERGVARELRREAAAVRALSIPDLPFLRR